MMYVVVIIGDDKVALCYGDDVRGDAKPYITFDKEEAFRRRADLVQQWPTEHYEVFELVKVPQ